MNMIRSLDCAFIFYSNYPCRLTLTELDVDVPCEGHIFNSEHPFTEDDFCFSRKATVADFFQELLTEHVPCLIPSSEHNDAANPAQGDTRAGPAPPSRGQTKTMLDLFLSIHCKDTPPPLMITPRGCLSVDSLAGRSRY